MTRKKFRLFKKRDKMYMNNYKIANTMRFYHDINAHKNAIYSNCTTPINNSAQDVKSCKKGIGGAYNPEKQPRVSIVKGGVVYREMTKFWKWGGEIEGSTKDIMHFSVTGY